MPESQRLDAREDGGVTDHYSSKGRRKLIKGRPTRKECTRGKQRATSQEAHVTDVKNPRQPLNGVDGRKEPTPNRKRRPGNPRSDTWEEIGTKETDETGEDPKRPKLTPLIVPCRTRDETNRTPGDKATASLAYADVSLVMWAA